MSSHSSPSRRRWQPAPLLYISLLVLAVLAYGLAFTQAKFGWGAGLIPGGALLTAAALILGLDLLLSRQQRPLEMERQVAGSLAVDQWAQVTVILRHSFNNSLKVRLFDGIPASVDHENLPLEIHLRPGQMSRSSYRIRPLARGNIQLQAAHIQVPSPFGLWRVNYTLGETQKIRVYPDFMAIAAYALLATDNHTSQIGIKKKPRRGMGLEFQQLREYRLGDSLRQIDWKATSRRRALISREYQDERDQQIVLLVDSGRRMRAKDDELSHFDHALNARLLVAYIALRQGDNVGVMSFGESDRWIPPLKGVDRIKHLLNGVYDLHAGQCAPDYASAAEKLSLLQSKRSLVILVTNSRDEDVDELMLAVNLLKRRHLVMVANIRELVIDQLAQTPVEDFDQALSYAGVQQYLESRAEVQRKLQAAGVYSLDCTAPELAVRVANSYLEIKRAGVL
jgi:uncharacterized protein (DUF58 family)